MTIQYYKKILPIISLSVSLSLFISMFFLYYPNLNLMLSIGFSSYDKNEPRCIQPSNFFFELIHVTFFEEGDI